MSSIPSIDTSSVYSASFENRATTSAKQMSDNSFVPKEQEYDYRADNVDLSNYYQNIRPEDLFSEVGNNVVQSAQSLDNAMVAALANGYTVNDVCNIKSAQAAYRANCTVFKSVIELAV